nr:Gag-Pol polyprotein [Tanacetum cinerariifolium]
MVYDKRTRLIVKTIHVNFDELPEMTSDKYNSGLAPQCQTMAFKHNHLSPEPLCQENVPIADTIVTTSLKELEILSVGTRQHLDTDGEMCIFALTVSQAEPKNIKEAMADQAWKEAMQEELHLFERLDVWKLVDRPYNKNVIGMISLWKNKRDEKTNVIRNKACLVAKGYCQEEGTDFKESFAQVA